MDQLDYIGWLAMLWIAFNIFAVSAIVKRCDSSLEAVDLLEFLTVFWRLPSMIFNKVFSWRLPEWTGVLFWFAPLYTHIIYRYSMFVSDYDGWYFSIGNLVFLWVR